MIKLESRQPLVGGSNCEVTDRMMPGHVSIPNGFGLDNQDGTRSGVAPNELTSLADCDKFAGTPHHKFVPAKIEAMA